MAERHPEPNEPRPQVEITHEMIARRAFELWLVRGGTSEENWLAAERELREEHGLRSR